MFYESHQTIVARLMKEGKMTRRINAVAVVKMLLGLSIWAICLSSSGHSGELTVGLIPAENNEEMVAAFEPMRRYLEGRLEEPVRVYTATDYTGIIEAMRKNRLDIAWFGPMSYYLAEREANAEAFVIGVRDGGTAKYHSIITVPEGSSANTLEDLRGQTVAFVDPASTSGGLVPRYMVKRATGLMPEEFFGRLIWAGSHDAAQLAVKNNTVDAAAGADMIYERMIEKGLITDRTNRVIMVSDALPGAPLAWRSDLDSDRKRRILDAFLDAHNHTDVSGLTRVARFEVASPADYEVIRDMVIELGLSDEQIQQ
jgi:phosphonate transport system substrate-binding protein